MGSARSARLVVVLAALLTTGCDREGDELHPKSDPQPTPPTTVSAAGAKPGRFVQPPRRAFDSNPLRLPVQPISLSEGQHIYAPAKRALEGARRGSTLALRFATALGVDGGNVVVRVGREPPFPVHPGYIVVPGQGRLRRGGHVIAPYRGRLRHAVVVAIRKNRVTVRYTDVGIRLGERTLRESHVAPHAEGLRAGNYAVYHIGKSFRHVLLVSSGTWGDGKQRWLALGYGAEALLVEHGQLRALPLDFEPSTGDPVWVAWLGRMVPATVRAADSHGIFTVERPVFGSSLVVGPDQLMAPPKSAP